MLLAVPFGWLAGRRCEGKRRGGVGGIEGIGGRKLVVGLAGLGSLTGSVWWGFVGEFFISVYFASVD